MKPKGLNRIAKIGYGTMNKTQTGIDFTANERSMGDCSLTQKSDFSAVLWRWDDDDDDDDVLFVQDQHAYLDIKSAYSSQKQQLVGRHVAPFGQFNLIPSQPVFALSP